MVPTTYSVGSRHFVLNQFQLIGRMLMHNPTAEVDMVCTSTPQELTWRLTYVPIGPACSQQGCARVLNCEGRLLRCGNEEMSCKEAHSNWYRQGKTLLEKMLPRQNIVFVVLTDLSERA